MNQFKDVFLGQGKRAYTRAVNSQLCVRVSGKHNDLEEVGFDGTHLTSFEMLGNWSFGDYYKKEAILWAWELFTTIYKLPKDKLYATVYKDDDESMALWKAETDINPAHILKCDERDNFWEMGTSGPCGPCSEVHIDLGPDACDKKGVAHNCRVNGDCHRYVELWNLVFIQFNRNESGTLEPLPKKHVDTGAGLERIAAYLQRKHSVYDTDVFKGIITEIEHLTKSPYDQETGAPHRVIADHIRTVTCAIADNVLPSNEGRGYVIRRIIRRALRYAQKLNVKEPVLYKLVDTVIEQMKSYSPELISRAKHVKTILKSEEEGFLKTLFTGVALFETLAESALKDPAKTIAGAEAFKLYDTFGFPVDLTAVLAKEKGLKIDMAGFEIALNEQKARSRDARKQIVYEATAAPIGGEARLTKTDEERLAMARHHSVTHLLHAALRENLGTHVAQAGSLVDIDRLRFDFSHFHGLSKEELTAVEARVNQWISQNLPVTITEQPIAEAKASGALSFFGEKYDDIVKVVAMGAASKELCGGTHVKSTKEIESFKIISESAIAAGTRRIEAIAGSDRIAEYLKRQTQEAREALEQRIRQIKAVEMQIQILDNAFKAPEIPLDYPDVESYKQAEIRAMELFKKREKELAQLKTALANTHLEGILKAAKPLAQNPQGLIAEFVANCDTGMLKTLAENASSVTKGLVALGSIQEDKGFFVVKSHASIATQFSAAAMLSKLTQFAGGRGGGKPEMAQAGGADPTKVEAALKEIPKWLQSKNKN